MGGPDMAPHTQRSERPGEPGALLYSYRLPRTRFEAAGGLRAAGRDGRRTAIASTSTRSSGRTSPLTTSNVFGG